MADSPSSIIVKLESLHFLLSERINLMNADSFLNLCSSALSVVKENPHPQPVWDDRQNSEVGCRQVIRSARRPVVYAFRSIVADVPGHGYQFSLQVTDHFPTRPLWRGITVSPAPQQGIPSHFLLKLATTLSDKINEPQAEFELSFDYHGFSLGLKLAATPTSLRWHIIHAGVRILLKGEFNQNQSKVRKERRR